MLHSSPLIPRLLFDLSHLDSLIALHILQLTPFAPNHSLSFFSILARNSAKLLLAFAGWVIGYDGHFEFENIGESYIDNKVPYIGLRTLPALLGSAVPPVMYAIMRESGYPRLVGLLSASLVLFGESQVSKAGVCCDRTYELSRLTDNAHITQTRLILLDAPLVLFMCLAFYAYTRFYKLRYSYAVHFFLSRSKVILS